VSYVLVFKDFPVVECKVQHSLALYAFDMRALIRHMNFFRTSLLVMGLLFCLTQPTLSADHKTEIVASEKLTAWIPDTQSLDGTVTFLSDDRIALSVCHINGDFHCPLLIVLAVANGEFHELEKTERSRPFGSLHMTTGGGVLFCPNFGLGLPAELLSAELLRKLEIESDVEVSLSGKTVGTIGPNNTWTVSRICPSLDCVEGIRNGAGKLQAVSDDQIAILDTNTIRIETIEGKHVGSFGLQPNCAAEVEFVDQKRIYVRSCGHDRVVDPNGNTLLRLSHPGYWGADARRLSADGTRLLYDQTFRKVSALKNAGELAVAILTLGVGVLDEVDNSEAVRVLDTTTGERCFDWKNYKRLANMGVYPHAALSPSGRFVALVSEGELRVYRLPEVCSAQ
jgi:hypothetical protein